MAINGADPVDDTFNIDSTDTTPVATEPAQPLFRIYEGSRVAVGRAVGQVWKKKLDAANTAYEKIYKVWEDVFQYYNNNQSKITNTPRGVFKRGDGTENVIFSNLNIMLPAVYSKDPDITCSTTDQTDEVFCESLQNLINTLFKRRNLLNAKPKIKKATGMGLLTNFGVLKLTFTKKDDSREQAINEMTRLTDELGKASKQEDVDRIYGELQALEQNIEVLEPSGPGLGNVLSRNLIIDPYAEQPDATDANWMIERTFMPTAGLIARFTKEDGEQSDTHKSERVLVYKPTHKANFTQGADRDDGIGVVMEAIGSNSSDTVGMHTDDERTAYINMYYTECYFVWDKATRRVMLFHRDDWTWPLWVWDDPLGLTRFFPYFVIGFALSTGGTVSVGETAYILDQQDEINDINRQASRIRRTVFDYFFFNSDKITDVEEVEKFIKAVRGETESGKHIIGVRAGDGKVADIIESFAPPAMHYDKLFDKSGLLDSINRITNTSDALRGTQFKTNTNVASANLYQQSMQLSVGSKVDVVEDVVADVALALAELAVQNYSVEDVAGLIGDKLAAGWRQMDVVTFRTTYSLELVAGSMEKPNSTFKKKEAIEVSQAIGQFAQAAPGATLRIMLRVLQQAFTEVVIKKEDWAALDAEVQATMNKGVSTNGGAASTQTGGQGGDLAAAASKLTPEAKQKVVQMKQAGASDQDIVAFIQQQGQAQPQAPQSPQTGVH